jgi:hypothetical protein
MGKLTAEEIVQLSKRYTLYDWQAQSKASPIAIDRAKASTSGAWTASASSISTAS